MLPIKLPPLLATSLVAKNGVGRLEQELSGLLNETLVLLGSIRPKYLQANITASACIYLALLLKIRAKTLPPHIREQYVERLKTFERECRLGETLKAAITAQAACGSGVKGVRAVLTGVHESDDITVQPVTITAEELTTMQQRFDEITQARSQNLAKFTTRLPQSSEN